jgi:hypothetical protein
MTMIERVARAIKQREHQDGNYHDLARAAIAAMREPTEEMRNEGRNMADDVQSDIGGRSIEYHVWQAMIDAALSNG